MTAYLFLLHVAGAVALLLWAVHMVHTGIERGWQPEITALLRASDGPVRSVAVGTGLAVVLQSATAAGMLAAAFAAKGMFALSTGLAIALGADFGSALVVLLLSLDMSVVRPILLVAGAALFFKGRSRRVRQSGRALVGLGLIFTALALLGEATAPLRESELVPLAAAYLGKEAVTALLAGAAIAWLFHSSVATILLLVVLAGHGLVPIEAAAPLLLGANIGGALIPFVLTRAGAPEARRMTAGNLLLRGAGALIALLGLQVLGARMLPGDGVAQQIIWLHLMFNAALVLAGVPLRGAVARLMERLIHPAVADPAAAIGVPPSCLDEAAVGDPGMALASTTRELLRMAEIVARMFEPVMEIYKGGDPDKIREARVMEAAIDQAQSDIKLYLARVSFDGDATSARRGQDLAAIAVNLEYVGDAITKTLLRLAETRREQRLKFSPTGWRELAELHQQVVENMRLARNVLVSRDLQQARKLVVEKTRMREAVAESQRQHLQRLKDGTEASLATSNIHLETLRALKTINSLMASIGYLVLDEAGEVLDHRLKPAG
ncbi:MAG: Na/Pi cotransporter family protein [Devosia sp.]|uniref:Na/Pi cotransporter family protein n=1 Tax=Devosia sp. TaxID=1871048 RepID=UPI002631C9A2|nr:Na/Pi cotransporter family protein [Devosia sp.]MDB5538834.1 Na/Pi cotransporter family protein [Devosia sp.]